MGKFLGILFFVYFAVTGILVEGLGMDVAGVTGSTFVLIAITCFLFGDKLAQKVLYAFQKLTIKKGRHQR